MIYLHCKHFTASSLLAAYPTFNLNLYGILIDSALNAIGLFYEKYPLEQHV